MSMRLNLNNDSKKDFSKYGGRSLLQWFSSGVGHYLREGGCLVVSALNSRSSGPGSSPGRGHCAVFLGKTLYSHSASLHPGV